MKALFIYNPSSGHQKIDKKLDYITSRLNTVYSVVDVYKSESKDDFINACKKACNNYDALIFAGGDGTFNLVVNALASEDNIPILGVIPSGTINDGAKNFGITKDLTKAVDIILKQKVSYFDVGKINDQYFMYVAAIGTYADIPFTTSTVYKKKIGFLAYYFKALKEVFKLSKIEGDLTINHNKKIHYKTPFILVLNSSFMGGFKINSKSNISDGKFDLFLAKPEPFNGLLSYLFFKKRVQHYYVTSINVNTTIDNYWDIDGEKGPKGDVKISVVSNKFRIFSK